ncbi:uncharacterized protein RBU33_008315 isoform 6-T6 [Hipposideros larvatus]
MSSRPPNYELLPCRRLPPPRHSACARSPLFAALYELAVGTGSVVGGSAEERAGAQHGTLHTVGARKRRRERFRPPKRLLGPWALRVGRRSVGSEVRGGLAPPAGAARCLPPAQARVLEGLGPARLPSGLQETESPAQARAQRGASSSSTAGVPWKHSHLVGTGAQSGTGALRAGGHFGSAAQDGCVGARTAAPPQSTAGPRSGACVQSAGRTGSLPPGNPGGLSGHTPESEDRKEERDPGGGVSRGWPHGRLWNG